jgi:hypothetical protein
MLYCILQTPARVPEEEEAVAMAMAMAMAPVNSPLISTTSSEDKLIIGVVTLMEVELVVHRSI